MTPHGLERPQNRPWTRVFREEELVGLGLPPKRVLRRLDGLTCMGCHQSRSLAGFHVVGEERDPARRVDALGTGLSAHGIEDLPRRKAYLKAILAKRQPSDFRPPAERTRERAGYGEAGGLLSACTAHARPAGLRACGPADPCRPDYLCARTPDGGSACLPPYFVLQMRVDGHPKRPR